MINKTFALVRRALQVDSRDVRPHMFRCALAGIVLFTLWTIRLDRFSFSAPGKELFTWVLYYNYWFITAAGATFFATAITEEKEERTLGLMKMAGVGAAAVLAGKWIPRLIGALLLILIQIPFTVLAITLGGVLWQQIGAGYLTLLAHLFLVGNIGLFCSVVRPTTSSASGTAVFLIFLYHIVPYVLSSALPLPLNNGTWVDYFVIQLSQMVVYAQEMSALSRLSSIMLTGFNESLFSFQVIANVIAGAVLLFISWLLFEPCTRNDVEPEEATWLNKVRHLGSIGTSRRSWESALIWKDYHYLAGGLLVLLLKCFAYFFLVITFALIAHDWKWSRIDAETLGWTCWLTGILCLILETAVIVTRVYRDEKTKKTWSLLTMLPMSLPQLAYSKLFGASFALIPVLGCLFMSVLFIPQDLIDILEDILTDSDGFLFLFYFASQVILGLHLASYLSITSNWAVWPLAIFMGAFIIFMSNFMIFSCLSALVGGDEEGFIFLLGCIVWALNLTIHILIGRRLATMAGE